MEKVSIDDVDSWYGPNAVRRPVSRELGAEQLAMNYFELEPGEQFGFGYHRHPAQEELFYILEGTATFETDSGETDASAGEAARFAPGEWQLGRNDGDERVRALALGAPASESEAEVRRHCEHCGGREPTRIEGVDTGLVTICETCGAETGRFEN